MKRLAAFTVALAAFAVLAAAPAQAQTTFKVPFNFESGGKKFPAGSYVVTKTGDGQLTLQQVTTKKESVVAFTEKLKATDTPTSSEPRLVFDEVGDFAPSYTEYLTVYVLAEVWLSGQDGYLIHTTKGAHKSRVINGEPKTLN